MARTSNNPLHGTDRRGAPDALAHGSAEETSGLPPNAKKNVGSGAKSDVDHVSLSGDIEEICDRFEHARGTIKPLTIASCVEGWDEPERSKLLCELIQLELTWRQRAGISLNIDELRLQFPADSAAIDEALSRSQQANTICPTSGEETLRLHASLQNMRFLAEGGLGQVFIAEDSVLKREAAVKLIRADLIGDKTSCDQFRLEAEVTGRLDHPGIPIVYGMGSTSGGRLFYAMQYVQGTRLDQLIRRHHRSPSTPSQGKYGTFLQIASKLRRSNPKQTDSHSDINVASESTKAHSHSEKEAPELNELLMIFISICHTIGYAHRRGILHRDIKPSNVIHGKYGETITIDWGLALPVTRQGVFKDVAEQTLTPHSGRGSRSSIGSIGTPAFMSPEQAAGNVLLTPASDIFCLGATLYCILTGVPPYKAASIREVRQKAIDADYIPVEQISPSAPPAVRAICHKAMSREISARYRTTHELIADLHAYLSDQPVSALDESNYLRLSRWTRKNTSLVLIAMLCTTLLTLGTALLASRKSIALASQINTTDRERSLREDGLQMAANLAARTVSSHVDLALRTLELAAQDSALVTALEKFNSSADVSSSEDVQSWLNVQMTSRFSKMQYRAWFVMSDKGTTIARFPEFSDGVRASSIGKDFSFRDYFHGLGQDLPPGLNHVSPITSPHLSTAVFSSNDAELTANFSVPVLNAEKQVIGVLAITVDRKTFFDIKTQQPEAQQLLLVETRSYPMYTFSWSDSAKRFEKEAGAQWSAGLVLHHEDSRFHPQFNALPRLSPRCLDAMLTYSQQALPIEGHAMLSPAVLFKEADRYRDPLNNVSGVSARSHESKGAVPNDAIPDDGAADEAVPDEKEQWSAAFAPVMIETRDDPQLRNTGWFVIVHQRLRRSATE